MLGPPKPRRLDEPIAVSLEDLVPGRPLLPPPGGQARPELRPRLDAGAATPSAAGRASTRSSSSSCSWSCSSRASARSGNSSRRPASTWPTAGISATPWTRTLPDHSSLTRIRQRLGIDIFQRFFEQVVDLCQEAGLVWGRELYFDATKVEANADLDSLVPRFYHEAKTHVADLFADDAQSACRSRAGERCCRSATWGGPAAVWRGL